MSRLTDTKRAYDQLITLLDQEMRKRSGTVKDLQRYRETLDVAFYLLGWAQFEYLVREEARESIDRNSKTKGIAKHAWQYLRDNVKNLQVLRRLQLIFHDKPSVLSGLAKDYELRNEAAHNYKMLPREAKDISVWLSDLEDLVDKF